MAIEKIFRFKLLGTRRFLCYKSCTMEHAESLLFVVILLLFIKLYETNVNRGVSDYDSDGMPLFLQEILEESIKAKVSTTTSTTTPKDHVETSLFLKEILKKSTKSELPTLSATTHTLQSTEYDSTVFTEIIEESTKSEVSTTAQLTLTNSDLDSDSTINEILTHRTEDKVNNPKILFKSTMTPQSLDYDRTIFTDKSTESEMSITISPPAEQSTDYKNTNEILTQSTNEESEVSKSTISLYPSTTTQVMDVSTDMETSSEDGKAESENDFRKMAHDIEQEVWQAFVKLYLRPEMATTFRSASTTKKILGENQVPQQDTDEDSVSHLDNGEEQKGTTKFGEACSEHRECKDYPRVRCMKPRMLIGLDRMVCRCDYLHTEVNKTCVLNVFSPCSDLAKTSFQCGNNMDCKDDPLGLEHYKFCRCKPGYVPMENEDGIPAFCVKLNFSKDDAFLLKQNEHRDYTKAAGENINLQLTHFKILVTATIFYALFLS